jgi:restriction system protein
MAYCKEVRHSGLKKYRLIKNKDRRVVTQMAAAQLAQWEAMWARQCDLEKKRRDREAMMSERTRAAERKRLDREAMMSERTRATERKRFDREAIAQDREAKMREAIERTREAEEALQQSRSILRHTLGVNDRIDWNALKDRSRFSTPQPRIHPLALPEKPDVRAAEFQVYATFLDALLVFPKMRKRRRAVAASAAAMARWKSEVSRLTDAQEKHEAIVKRELGAWQAEKAKFEADQRATNEAIDADREAYSRGDSNAVEDYCDLVLMRSEYPPTFPQEFTIEHRSETGTVIVEYRLPTMEDLPSIKDVKYVQARDEFKESVLSAAELKRLHEDVVYQIVLRTIHELLEADAIKALKAVAFNGVVDSVDRATGKRVRPCIVSMHVTADEFNAIDLGNVEPKACFRRLKGVSASTLAELTPVAPLLQLDRQEERFEGEYEVASKLSAGANLAAMPWEDFEHLVRELFEREFGGEGAEVRVTRADWDGGVDAVVFDPHPIRGGKIVIQAKRYTNTVSVSAVRDLFGTVLNEGAIKGVLVTTADYGPDAYSFAKDKPLTLLNGNNLLHMLQKHGQSFKIDLKEAKQTLSAEEQGRSGRQE